MNPWHLCNSPLHSLTVFSYFNQLSTYVFRNGWLNWLTWACRSVLLLLRISWALILAAKQAPHQLWKHTYVQSFDSLSSRHQIYVHLHPYRTRHRVNHGLWSTWWSSSVQLIATSDPSGIFLPRQRSLHWERYSLVAWLKLKGTLQTRMLESRSKVQHSTTLWQPSSIQYWNKLSHATILTLDSWLHSWWHQDWAIQELPKAKFQRFTYSL